MKNFIQWFIYIFPISLWGQAINFPFQNPDLAVEVRVDDLLNRLTLAEKVAQMQDVAPAIERLGIPKYNWWNECLHGVARAGSATSFPQGIGLAATWNTQLIHEVASAISTEARAKFNHSINIGQRNRYQGLTMWTPNINIFRDPRWGRGQETYGEDPYLTSKMGVAFVKGLQGTHPKYFKVIATPKHYAVHSGPEYNRHSFDAYTDKRDLWDTYLPAFKATIVEGKAFSIMSAYNRYLGVSATASPLLLNAILRDKWGFEGYVVSDCGAVSDIYQFHKIVETAAEASALAVKAGCDLNCGTTYKYLSVAIENNLITEKDIDVAVRRLFTARIKLGLLNPPDHIPFSDILDESLESEAHQQLALKTARESLVLLKNQDNTLPLAKDIQSITIIGPTANDRHFVLGNYFGTPTYSKTILEGIKEKVGTDTKVHYFKGTNLTDNEPIFDVIDQDVYVGGVRTAYFDNADLEGKAVYIQTKRFIDFEWGGAAPIDVLSPGNFSIRYTGSLKPDFNGKVALGIQESGGSFNLWIDGEAILIGQGGNGMQISSSEIEVEKDSTYQIVLEYKCTNEWMASIQLLWNKEQLKGREHMLQKASESEVIVYVGGITARLEGEEMPVAIEGFSKGDRTNLQLPKAQLTLLQNLYKLGKPVVFILNSGSAMAINWAQEQIPSILHIWYPGQAGGEAVADVLFGDYNPSGRLPLTFYKSIDDLPPFEDYHMQGRTYRYFTGPVLYPFGFGLSYTNFSYSKPQLEKTVMQKNDLNRVEVIVENTGSYDGETVVQLYINDQQASVVTPLKSLKGFKKIFLNRGESKTVQFDLSKEELSIVDYEGNSFLESGIFEIFIGENSATTNKVLLTVK